MIKNKSITAKHWRSIRCACVLACLPLQQAHAIFALETTMQTQIGPELSGIKAAVGNVAPAIVKANTAIGQTIVAAMHELTQNYGLATAENQVSHEFGGQSTNQNLCTMSGFATTLLQNQMSVDEKSHQTTRWFESVINAFPSRSQSTDFVQHKVIRDITVSRDTLLPTSNVFSEKQWESSSAMNMFMLTPEPPLQLTFKQKTTFAGQQHSAYKKLYQAKQTYVNAALADDAAERIGTIPIDQWRAGSASIIPANIIQAMQASGHNMSFDADKNQWMLSKKSALKALSDSRYGNAVWWQDVGGVKTTAWQQREQTALAALQLETSLRILEKLEHLVRLQVLTTQEISIEPMRHRVNTLVNSARQQTQSRAR